jgi:branched-chain amino acid transport system permease protein
MSQYYLSQLFNGLVNGGFIALMSLGLSVIFGMMRVVNFAHGALYMLGAFIAFIVGSSFGLSLWVALIVAPLVIGGFGLMLERLFLRRLYGLDPSYNLLLTFGLTLIIEDTMRHFFAVQGAPFLVPASLAGAIDLGFMVYPKYRFFVLVLSLAICAATWLLLERTRLGALVRAGTERPALLRCFGVRVPLLVCGTFAFAAGLAAIAGVLASPLRNISPFMGQEMIATTFAVVVAGGLGSIAGSVVMGFVVGVVSALAAVWYPPAANAATYILMVAVLIVRPGGIFRGVDTAHFPLHYTPITPAAKRIAMGWKLRLIALAIGLVLPWFVYPVLACDIVLWGLCALGFDMLFAFAGLLSFGQAAYWGGSAYVTGILIAKLHYPMWAGLVGGVAVSTLVSLAFGALIARKKGIYFSMVTFALAEIVYFVINQSPRYTGGEDGLHGIARGSLLGISLENQVTFYYAALALTAAAVAFVFLVIRSPFGLASSGARDSERRMLSVGYDVERLRLRAYVLSAFLISIAGSLFALNHEFVSLESVYWRASGEPIMMTLLGGAGTVFGPMLGAGIVVFLRDCLSTVTDSGSLVLGVTFVIVVLVFRRGVLGEILHRLPSIEARLTGGLSPRARHAAVHPASDDTPIQRSTDL